MELRNFSHFHYIHAIKGGLVTKVLNINSRGKPAIVFKKLTDIYESIYDKAQVSLPTQWSREGLEENIPDRCEFKVETQVHFAERKLSDDEPEVSGSDSKGDTDGQKSDVEVDSMTIQQIMEGCKKRKLRQSKSVDSSKEKLKTCPRLELNHSSLLSDEDDSDLDVVLSIWKSKLSKRKKLKTKCDESRISTSSQCGETIGISDPINSDQDLLPSSSDLPILVVVKVEAPKTDVTASSQCGQTIGSSDLINCDQDLLSSSSDLPILVDVKVEAPETVVTEVQNTSCIIDELSLLCDENVNSCLSSGPIAADELFFSPELTSSVKEAENCSLNSACHEYLEGDELGTEWMNEDNPEVHKPHYSDFPASESMEGQYTSSCVSNDSTSEAISLTEEQCFGTYISQGKSTAHKAICLNNGEVFTHLHGMTDLNSLQLPEMSLGAEDKLAFDNEKSIPTESTSDCLNNGEVFTHLHGLTDLNSLQLPEMCPGAEDKLAFDNEKSIPTESTSDCNLSPDHGESISPKSTSDCNLSPDHGKSISTNSISDHNISPDQHLISIGECPTKERQPQMSDYSDSERNTSPDFRLGGSMDKFIQFEEPKRHPTRLLSTRTIISPTSQERLSKAMKSMRLHDKECKTCGDKPYFNQINHKVGTAEESDQMKRVYSDKCHEQNIRKSKKRSFHSASTTKVPHATVQNCSDSAIAFTQRQMQDIECLALKLTKQLESMKAIVEDRLHVEGNKAISFKFNTDEVRTAVADATKAEARTRKWLSMMSRDCNRFCKIMKTAEHGSNSSPTPIQKVKRKITFADEAGGKLCEVRLIEDDVNAEKTFVETSPEKCEIVK